MVILFKVILTIAVLIGLVNLVDMFVDEGTKEKEIIGIIGGMLIVSIAVLMIIFVLWLIWGA